MRALLFGAALSIVFGSMLGAQVIAGRTMTFGSSGIAYMGAAVTGAPYSAEQVFERTQTLADGTHINQKPQITKMYRDSQGRKRTERPMFVGPAWASTETPVIVEIRDPVAGFQYTLDMQEHVAHRVVLTKPGEAPSRVATLTTRALATTSSAAPPPPPPATSSSSKTWSTSAGPSGSDVCCGFRSARKEMISQW